MLFKTRSHLIPPNSNTFSEPRTIEILHNFSSPSSGTGPGAPVFRYQNGTLLPIVEGILPREGQKILYVDGAFDLFTPGHVEILRLVYTSAESPYVVVGVHDDHIINEIKGHNYPIMNTLERSLVVLQCKYVSAVIISARYMLSKSYLTKELGILTPAEVWHGPTNVTEDDEERDPYTEAWEMELLRVVNTHPWEELSASKIVERIWSRGLEFEERQKKKGVKSELEREMKMNENF